MPAQAIALSMPGIAATAMQSMLHRTSSNQALYVPVYMCEPMSANTSAGDNFTACSLHEAFNETRPQ